MDEVNLVPYQSSVRPGAVDAMGGDVNGQQWEPVEYSVAKRDWLRECFPAIAGSYSEDLHVGT